MHARLPWGGALSCAYLWKRDGSPRLSRSLPGFSPIAESNGLQVWRFRNVAPAAAETAQNCMRNTDKHSIGYSHSIVAASICMVSRLSSCHLVRLLSRNPNHFVITGVITNPPNSANIAVFRNDSPAITPRNTNGDNGRWFAMAIIHRLTSSQRLFRELCRNRSIP